MARSWQGGTRGFLRGRVASDLYQVTTDERGRKIQLVRAVEETRTNNNTNMQALARMKMGCLMRALSQLKEIVDHSWESVPYGQLSIARFVEVNMPYVNWDCYNNWAMPSCFMYPAKGDTEYMVGAFVIAEGTLPYPQFIYTNNLFGQSGQVPFFINIGKSNPTFRDLRLLMGLNVDDYITILLESGFNTGLSGIRDPRFAFLRMYLSHDIDDSTQISSANIAKCFRFEGNSPYAIQIMNASGLIRVRINIRPDGVLRDGLAYALITSRWDGLKWRRNNARFVGENGAFQIDMGDYMPNQAFSSWFEDWSPETGWGKYDADQYPGDKPERMTPVPDAQ